VTNLPGEPVNDLEITGPTASAGPPLPTSFALDRLIGSQGVGGRRPKGYAVFTKIVVGTDGSDTANAAVGIAIDLAKLFGAELHIVNAYQAVSTAVAAAQAGVVTAGAVEMNVSLLEGASQELLAKVAEAAAGVGVAVHTHSVFAPPPDAVVQVAEGINADLIVVGSKGMKRRVLGSVPNSVAHKSPCDVLIAKTA
jgi:nucleotide-binding universal stress UspA family protein